MNQSVQSQVNTSLHFSGGKVRTRRLRYDPTEDPNFNINSSVFNNDLRESIHMTNLSPRELQDLEKKAEEEKKSDTSQGNISISDDETTERKLTSALSKSSISVLQ